MKRIPLGSRKLPRYTKGEEIMNMVTHIVGGALAILALIACPWLCAVHKNTIGIISSAIYGFSIREDDNKLTAVVYKHGSDADAVSAILTADMLDKLVESSLKAESLCLAVSGRESNLSCIEAALARDLVLRSKSVKQGVTRRQCKT